MPSDMYICKCKKCFIATKYRMVQMRRIVVSGIQFWTTNKIGIEISAARCSFLSILGPCVEQRNKTSCTILDLARLLMSEVNPANTKVPK